VETLKTGDPAFARVSFTIVARNADAVAGAQSRARELTGHGCATVALAGEARAAGRAIAEQLRNIPAPGWIIAGGETSVTLSEPRAPGGRCQELALAAAQELRGEHGVALLAAGTDGRDGTTDAAGAIVDGATWERIRTAGIDPAAALASHRANEALARADALVRTGPTGTNVMDLVVGVRL
jgi:hydroxypyruvate reductase